MALDELLAWRVENGRDKEPLMRTGVQGLGFMGLGIKS